MIVTIKSTWENYHSLDYMSNWEAISSYFSIMTDSLAEIEKELYLSLSDIQEKYPWIKLSKLLIEAFWL